MELGKDVIEIMGEESLIEFPTRSNLRYLAVYLKNMDRFLKIVIKLQDSSGKIREFTISNRRTTVFVQNSMCQLPMDIGPAWQYFCIDLADITNRCFGTSYYMCTEVQIHGSTRLAKMYLQAKRHADAELPLFLRVLSTPV